jgi:hypothetical protein
LGFRNWRKVQPLVAGGGSLGGVDSTDFRATPPAAERVSQVSLPKRTVPPVWIDAVSRTPLYVRSNSSGTFTNPVAMRLGRVASAMAVTVSDAFLPAFLPPILPPFAPSLRKNYRTSAAQIARAWQVAMRESIGNLMLCDALRVQHASPFQ